MDTGNTDPGGRGAGPVVNGPALHAAAHAHLALIEPWDERPVGWTASLHDAITAILHLHRPHETGYGEDISYVCGECYYHNSYPCPTVREIVDAFGMEYEEP